MTKPLQFSYSFLDAYDNCPEQARHTYVLRTYKKTWSVKGGIDIHKAIESRFRYKEPLPVELAHVEPTLASLERRGKPKVEVSYAVDRELKPVGFWDGWLRGKYDIVLHEKGHPRAFIADHKSGKVRESSDQLEIGAMLMMKTDPAVETVTGVNLWLAAPKILGTPYIFHRDYMGPKWAKWLARMNTIEQQDPTQEWERRDSVLCTWCPVQVCPHYRGG